MRRSTRRLILLLAALPATLVLIACLYMAGMDYLEGTHRGFWDSLEWAAETLTTTGYGADSRWHHPLMVVLVVTVQFAGMFLVFLIFPIYVIPFFEERFEARLPSALPRPRGPRYVLIYRYGPTVAPLVEELQRHRRRVVVLEEDQDSARRLLEQGLEVVRLRHTLGEVSFAGIGHALAVVANGSDHENAALLLIVREQGFSGAVHALVEDPLHRQPLITWGAAAVYTPAHLLAAALAARASRRLSPALQGVQQLGEHLGVAELRIHTASPLAGATLAQAHLRERLGVVVLGYWSGGRFIPRPRAATPLSPGNIIVVIGRQEGLERLGKLAVPLRRRGPIVIAGFGAVGRKVGQMLVDAGEHTTTLDCTPGQGVDVVGNALDQGTLERAGVREAGAVILALSDDSEGLFAATVVRELAPEVPLIARVNQAQTVHRLYRVGADFALSTGQVAGQLLAQHLLGEEYISLEQDLKLVKVEAGALAGHHPFRARVQETTGCQVVAIERAGEVLVELDDRFQMAEDDAVFIAGSHKGVEAYHLQFHSRRAPRAERGSSGG
jgi:Trk K+ transport system NAD-binding subunit